MRMNDVQQHNSLSSLPFVKFRNRLNAKPTPSQGEVMLCVS